METYPFSAVVAEVEVDVVEAVEGARVEASSRCSRTQTQQLLAGDSNKTVRRMTMVDGAVCDLGHAQDRGGNGAGCSKCRAQIRGGDDDFLQEHRGRCPRENDWRRGGGSSACLTKTWRRVAPPPEKATTPVG